MRSGEPSSQDTRLAARTGVKRASDALDSKNSRSDRKDKYSIRTGSRRGAQKTFGEETVLRPNAWQDKEIPSAHRLDVLLKLLAVEACLHGEKPAARSD
jgi:hypothetical protein